MADDFDLRKEFAAAVARHKVNFYARGMLTSDDRVLPLGTDTKVLSTVFELLTRPLVVEIAKTHGYAVLEAPQTIYPDFTLLRGKNEKNKIAIDIKTTYRRPDIVFTLGSYTSFLRNNTKNILFPYDHYVRHWIVGFVYTRVNDVGTDIASLDQRNAINAPYKDVEWFVQEKYKIASGLPGSGTTTNIGSIRTPKIADFVAGEGPFAEMGEEGFREGHHCNGGESAGPKVGVQRSSCRIQRGCHSRLRAFHLTASIERCAGSKVTRKESQIAQARPLSKARALLAPTSLPGQLCPAIAGSDPS
jgi:hypothetical protein